MEWLLMPYRRYADFSGRSRRMEYWMFHLFFWMILFGSAILSAVVGLGEGDGSLVDFFEAISGIILAIFIIGSIIPLLAVTVRRLHDQDKSGWYYLLALIPYLGSFILLFFMCTKGTFGENQYGHDPMEPNLDTDVFA